MIVFALRRMASAIPTLLVLVVLAFCMMRAAPGGPFDTERVLPDEVKAQLEAQYRLDLPLVQQLGHYLADVLRGDLGPSFQYAEFSVNELIGQSFPVSLQLGLSALLLALVTT